ncbi:CarD family transcriptional regulator [Brachybacterium sp. J144]|uniref:CarD family transcriptional regulator n=1 Tax=unclassified Brachybacterium TaxID=2623841 RepID=UPI002E7A39E1|nr:MULTISPECIES: CarD family transcriptional regulator [unclassified Brachybacterium]MEE1618937.1 CarD family transcriptional regulator [Brachybacterium sp. J153]MEE1651730.1 CarD family transcriptional regulator [Brachybacterium sp. J144]
MSVAATPAPSSVPAIGSLLSHPVHGPVRIVARRTRTVRGEDREYVDLSVVDGEMAISVPADGKDVVGLRELLGEEEIVALLEQLAAPIVAPEKKASWAHRIKTLTMQLQTGRLTDRIEVVREIYGDSGGNPSSLAEKNLLKQAVEPLAVEIAIARDSSREETTQQMLDLAAAAVAAGEGPSAA